MGIPLISHFPPMQEILILSARRLIEEGVLTEKECEKLETESKEGTIEL